MAQGFNPSSNNSSSKKQAVETADFEVSEESALRNSRLANKAKLSLDFNLLAKVLQKGPWLSGDGDRPPPQEIIWGSQRRKRRCSCGSVHGKRPCRKAGWC